MKRVVCALLVSSGLLLAGCSATTEPESDTTITSSKTTEVEREFAQVGDSISVNCQDARCAGELRIEEILLGTGCKATLVAEDVPAGMQLVQVSAILTAVEKVTDGGGAEIGVTPEIPVAWDSENFKTTAEWEADAISRRIMSSGTPFLRRWARRSAFMAHISLPMTPRL